VDKGPQVYAHRHQVARGLPHTVMKMGKTPRERRGFGYFGTASRVQRLAGAWASTLLAIIGFVNQECRGSPVLRVNQNVDLYSEENR